MESTSRRLLGLCSTAAQQIQAESESILAGAAPDRPNASEGIAGCGGALVSLLAQQASQVSQFHKTAGSTGNGRTGPTATSTTRSDAEAEAAGGLLALQRLDDIASLAHAKFYAFVYRNLPFCWRQLYTDASILKFSLLVSLRAPSSLPLGQAVVAGDTGRDALAGDGEEDGVEGDENDDGDDARLTELVRVLDLALILAGGAGQQRGRAWIDEAFELLQQACCPPRHCDRARQPTAQGPFPDSERPVKRRRRLEEQDQAPSPRHTADRLFSTNEPFTPPVKHAIKRVPGPSLEAFQTYLTESSSEAGPQPLVLPGLVEDWPARTTNPWNSADYLLSRTLGGRRLVPVEVGRSYVDEGWGQKLLPFRDFLSRYIDPSLSLTSTSSRPRPEGAPPPIVVENNTTTNTTTNTTGYLAQHQLFTQLPSLRADILIPDLCYTSPPAHPTTDTAGAQQPQDQLELAAPLLNAWLGPPGTITPLHTDPYHNLLVQVVGRKYVRLYAPRATPRMRARGREDGVDMANTSALDVGVLEGWDRDVAAVVVDSEQEAAAAAAVAESERDAFRRIPFQDCILEPGDTLYIPVGWWHYVRGLSVSFSVSFWWN